MRTAALTLLLTIPLAAQPVRSEMLVSTEWLAGHSGSVKLLHIGSRAGYDSGHIPGAVLIEPSSLLVARDGVPNELPDAGALQAVFAAAGIGGKGRVVLYSDEWPLAERAWFTLDYLGHGGRAAILDGGLKKWTAEKRPLSTEPVTPEAAPFEATPRPEVLATLAAIREGKELLLLDSRPPAQFQDPGHIPGAVNVPLAANFKDGVLRSPAELLDLYGQAGVSKDSVNVAYCRSGMQAAVTYFVLRYLGRDARLYDGSWTEWSKAAGERP